MIYDDTEGVLRREYGMELVCVKLMVKNMDSNCRCGTLSRKLEAFLKILAETCWK